MGYHIFGDNKERFGLSRVSLSTTFSFQKGSGGDVSFSVPMDYTVLGIAGYNFSNISPTAGEADLIVHPKIDGNYPYAFVSNKSESSDISGTLTLNLIVVSEPPV